MNLSLSLPTSAAGIHRNVERLNAAAVKIARSDTVGQVEPLVEMMPARHGVQANINVFKVACGMNRSAVDMIA
jgi:flagellar basal body rod protein FlgC